MHAGPVSSILDRVLLMAQAINTTALRLFAPTADDYGTWSRWLSFWQDPRWRRTMIERLELAPGARILDVAAGTGEATRLLQQQGLHVISLPGMSRWNGERDDRFPDSNGEAVTSCLQTCGWTGRNEANGHPHRFFLFKPKTAGRNRVFCDRTKHLNSPGLWPGSTS